VGAKAGGREARIFWVSRETVMILAMSWRMYSPPRVVVLFAPDVGVGGDFGAGVGVELVLVDDPVEGGAVAELVGEGFEGYAGEGEGVVDGEGGFILGGGR
jgi:hypothetical protein